MQLNTDTLNYVHYLLTLTIAFIITINHEVLNQYSTVVKMVETLILHRFHSFISKK